MLGGVLRPRDSLASGHKDQGLLCLSTCHEQICHLKTCMWGLWRGETCHVLVGAKMFLYQPYSPLVLQREGTERLLHVGWFGVCLWVPNFGLQLLEKPYPVCGYHVKSGSQLHAMVIQGRCFTGLMLTKAQHGALFSLAMTEKALMYYIPEYC